MSSKKDTRDQFVADWDAQIKSGLEYRKKYSSSRHWESWRKMYRGQYKEGIFPVNKLFSYGRMLVPKVYYQTPKVCVTATRPDLIWHAKIVEALDNMLIKELKLKKTLKRAINDAYICGIGPIKLGYDSEFGYIPGQAVSDDGSTITQAHRKHGERVEYKDYIRPGMPWAARVMPEHVIVPWGAQDPDDLPWIAHYIARPLDDVKGDQKYRNTKDLNGTKIPNKDMQKAGTPRTTKEHDKEVTYAELYEVRDFKSGKIFTICEDELLLIEDDVLQTFGTLPWEFLIFNEDPEFFWPIPDVVNLVPQQAELNDTRTQASMHRKIALVKFLYKEGAVSQTELDKFLSGVVGPAVGIKGDDPLGASIMEMTPHIPPELYKEEVQILSAMQESLGFSPNQIGQFSPRHNTSAREAGIVEGGFEERIDERKDIMGDLLVNIVRKWNQYIFSFWSKEKVIKIVSPRGEPFWVEYTGDQLRGEYLLSVDPESGVPVNRVTKYQMAKEAFGMFNGDPMIDQMKLRQMMLGLFGTVDPEFEQLLANPQLAMPGIGGPQEAGMLRQPMPMLTGPGGQGAKTPPSGPTGSSPGNPVGLQKLAGGKQ